MTEKERRGRGQPPKGDRAKTETIRIRVTKAEREAIERAADARGEGLSEACRGALRKWAGRKFVRRRNG